MTTHLDEAHKELRFFFDERAIAALDTYMRAILAESRPSPATAGGAPSDEELHRIAQDGPLGKGLAEERRALYDAGFSAGERAERERNKSAPSVIIRGDQPLPPYFSVEQGNKLVEAMNAPVSVRSVVMCKNCGHPDAVHRDGQCDDCLDILRSGKDAPLCHVFAPAPPPPARSEKCPEPLPEVSIERNANGKAAEKQGELARAADGAAGQKVLGATNPPRTDPGVSGRAHQLGDAAHPGSQNEVRADEVATGTADPDATGGGAEVSDKELSDAVRDWVVASRESEDAAGSSSSPDAKRYLNAAVDALRAVAFARFPRRAGRDGGRGEER